jgi:hypothetical protein
LLKDTPRGLSAYDSVLQCHLKSQLHLGQGKSKTQQSLKSKFVVSDGGNDIVGQPCTLTTINLTDPVIDPESACVLFDICLAIFAEQTEGGKVVTLDEAHNVRPFLPAPRLQCSSDYDVTLLAR